MATRKTKRSATPPAPPPARARATYKAQLANGFGRALNGLGVQAATEIPAELEGFMKDFRAGRSDDELRNVWDYKDLRGGLARRAGVKQIKVCAHYRVALIADHVVGEVWFLNAFRRATNNEPAMRVSVSRAEEIRSSRGK